MIARRSFLRGIGGLFGIVAAPAIVLAANLMPVSSRALLDDAMHFPKLVDALGEPIPPGIYTMRVNGITVKNGMMTFDLSSVGPSLRERISIGWSMRPFPDDVKIAVGGCAIG